MVRYFIALLPPQEVQAAVNTIRQQFGDRYASRKAQNSPPHITLQPPFEWSEQALTLEQSLLSFARNYKPVAIQLAGFGAFAPRVIYINVLKTPVLLSLQAALVAYLEKELTIVDPSKSRTYAPHMTVAFQDLTPKNFRAAWAEFQDQAFKFEFVVPALTLLIHNGRNWDVQADFSFSTSVQPSCDL